MRLSSSVKDITWSSLFGALILSMVLGLSACSSGSSDSNDNFSPGGGDGGDGGASSPLCENNPNNECDFTVTLTKNGQKILPWEYSYGRASNVKDWKWVRDNTTSFDYLQTSQFTVSAAEFKSDLPEITITDKKNRGFNCAGFYWKKTFYYAKMNTSFRVPLSWKQSLPLQMTVIPWKVPNGGLCNNQNLGPDSVPDGTRALAIWVSAPSSKVSTDCHFTKDSTASKSPSCFKPPTWEVVDDYLIYKGSLVDWVRLNNNTKIPQNIRIDAGADLENMPLNTLFVRYNIDKDAANIAACEKWVKDANRSLKTPKDNCKVSGGKELTLLANHQINVSGTGRISGYQQTKETPVTVLPSYREAANIKNPERLQAQYRVYSGLLVLSSDYAPGYAIDVEGITVGFGPKRGSGAVQLNTPYAPAVSSLTVTDENIKKDVNNFKVNVSDLKVVGNWIDAADGPEIMGQNSTVKSLYLHVNDDSIKVAVNGIKISDVTVLQGDVGGVVDLGSYGYNRGSISGAVVNGVYVHRITHTTGYDPYNGLVVTRLCPIKPLCENCDHSSANLENATVANLQVNEVGEINAVQRPAAIGVLASYTASDMNEYSNLKSVPGFCSSTVDYASSVTIKNIKLVNWDIYEEPSADSKLYNNGSASDRAITYSWTEPSVKFFNGTFTGVGAKKYPDNAVRIHFKNKAPGKLWYAACGASTGFCYDNKGESSAVLNVLSQSPINSNVPNYNFLFPYK